MPAPGKGGGGRDGNRGEQERGLRREAGKETKAQKGGKGERRQEKRRGGMGVKFSGLVPLLGLA